MRKRHLASSVMLLTGLVHAEPHGKIEAALAQTAAKIQHFCQNQSLTFKVDWRAFEGLDFQALIASDNPQVAADPELMRRARKLILTGDNEGKGSIVMVGTVTGGASSAIQAFEVVCRDQPELRPAAAKITTIVLEPITDMKYLADRDKIALARRTNDWTPVQNAYDEEDRVSDAHFHMYRPRFAVSGTTLTVTQNVMGFAGGADEFSQALADALGGKQDDAKKPAERKPPPNTAKRDLGPQLDCTHDYTDVAEYSSDREYVTGSLVFITFSGQPTTLYRCTGRSGCEKGDSLLGPRWTLAGHC